MFGHGRPTYACIPCRYVSKYTSTCALCKSEMKCMGTRWTAPKRSNDRAWRRIDNGELFWDRQKVSRAQQKWRYYRDDRYSPRPNQKKGQRGRVYQSNKPKPVMPGK